MRHSKPNNGGMLFLIRHLRDTNIKRNSAVYIYQAYEVYTDKDS